MNLAGIFKRNTNRFQTVAIFFHIVDMRIRKPRIQKQIDFTGSDGGKDRSDIGILQSHSISLFLQHCLCQVTHGDAFRPVHIADRNLLRVFGTTATGKEHEHSQEQDQVDKYK